LLKYIARRTGEALLSLLGVSVLVFFLARATGDPAPLMAGSEASQADIDAVRERLGLDRPLPTQYLKFLSQLAHGDLGESLRFNRPASELIRDRFFNSFILAVCALAIAALIGVSIGMLASRKPRGIADRIGRIVALAGQSIPTFWVGLMLVLVLAVKWRIFPPSNFQGAKSLVLPAFTLGWFSTAALLRVTQSSMREALDSHYVTVARSKGLSELRVVGRHALRNSFVAILSIGALQFVLLLNGAVVTESIFNWPGIGQLMVQAAFARDYPMVQAIVIVAAVAAIAVNLLTDIAYAYFDPRIRFR
jgi:peptide/nickel transport system permease protein